jgi:hypothetical protein
MASHIIHHFANNKTAYQIVERWKLSASPIYRVPKVRDLPFQFMPEKGRRDSIIGTNGYWPELLAVKTNHKIKVPNSAEILYV